MKNSEIHKLIPTPNWQIVAFYISSFVAFIVHPMYSYSLVIYTRNVTQSDSLTGVVFLLVFGPFALFSLVGGIASDRYSRKGIIVIASALAALFIGGVALTINLGMVTKTSFGLLFLFAAVYGIIVPFMATARIAMVGNVLMPKSLGTGTIVMSIISVIGYGLGPLVAGMIKENGSWAWLFGFNSIGWVVSGLGFLLVTRMHPQAKSIEASHLEDFKDGLKFIFNNKLLLQLCLFMAILAIFVLGPYQTVMPEFLKQTFELGEKQRGSFMSIFGLGLLTGGILATVLRTHKKRGLLLVIAALLIGINFSLVAITSSYYPSLVFLCLSGVLGGLVNGLVSAMLQEESPDRVRGRVMSMHTFILVGVPALGGLLVSLFAEGTSLTEGIMYAGISAFACSALLSIFARNLRSNSHVATDDSAQIITTPETTEA